MLQDNNDYNLRLPIPKLNEVYGCAVATDGKRIIILDADVEIFNYVAQFELDPEDCMDLPSSQPGVYRLSYKYCGGRYGGWFDLVRIKDVVVI